jgi:hypothetical protein
VISPPPLQVPIAAPTGGLTAAWISWFDQLRRIVADGEGTFTTAPDTGSALASTQAALSAVEQALSLPPIPSFGTLAWQNAENVRVHRLSVLSTTTGIVGGTLYEDSGFAVVDGVSGVVTSFNGSGRTVTQNTGFRPFADNAYDLGTAPQRWKEVYAAVGTINTSDATEKQQVRSLSDAEQRVAARIKKLFRAFKWNDAVAKKGEHARIHIGVMAQDVKLAFEAEGLDAHSYAMFCSDDIPNPDGSSTPRLGVRYDQLLAFVISAM